MSLHKGVVHLSQFVVIRKGKVEMGRQTNIVGSNFSEFLYISNFFDTLNFGYRDLFFLVIGRRFGFLDADINDEILIVGVELVEFLLAADKLERLGPIEFGAFAHWY